MIMMTIVVPFHGIVRIVHLTLHVRPITRQASKIDSHLIGSIAVVEHLLKAKLRQSLPTLFCVESSCSRPDLRILLYSG